MSEIATILGKTDDAAKYKVRVPLNLIVQSLTAYTGYRNLVCHQVAETRYFK